MTDNFIQEKKLELKALRAKYRQATRELYDFQNSYTIKLISTLKENNLIFITCNHEQIDTSPIPIEHRHSAEEYHCISCKKDLVVITLAGQKFLMTANEQNIVNDFKNSAEHKSVYTNWIPDASPKVAKMLKGRVELHRQYEKVQNEIIRKVLDGMRKTGMISNCEHIYIVDTRKCKKCDAYLASVSVGNSESIHIEWDKEERKFKEIIATIPEMYGRYGYNSIDSTFEVDEQ